MKRPRSSRLVNRRVRRTAGAVPIMPDHLQKIASASSKNEQMASVWVLLQRLLNQQRQGDKALSHIGMAADAFSIGCSNPKRAASGGGASHTRTPAGTGIMTGPQALR